MDPNSANGRELVKRIYRYVEAGYRSCIFLCLTWFVDSMLDYSVYISILEDEPSIVKLEIQLPSKGQVSGAA
jgi:pimeloyl-CoA synthetase